MRDKYPVGVLRDSIPILHRLLARLLILHPQRSGFPTSPLKLTLVSKTLTMIFNDVMLLSHGMVSSHEIDGSIRQLNLSE